jgi:cytochrome c553
MKPSNLVLVRRSVALLACMGAGLASIAVGAQDIHQARNLAATCAGCHGTDGRAVGEMKSLAGVAMATIVTALADYKSGARPATVMHQVAKGYSDEQIALVARYFSEQGASK